MQDFEVLILGSDANAYYMARCTYEKYRKKAHLIAKDRLSFTKFSNILTIEYHDDLWDEESFVNILNTYAMKKEKNILVVSTNETYSIFLSKNKMRLNKNLYFFSQDEKTLLSLTNKELFYKTYKNCGLKFPETYYFDVNKNSILPTMEYPIVLKPANVVMYNHISFEGKNKIYKVCSEDELNEIIQKIKKSGYTDRLILQEFIPGDDSYLYDSVVYVDRKGLVKVLSFAEIGIQERSKSMVGNAAALINGINIHGGNVEKMKQAIIEFMEKLGMNGFFEFDMKYDVRTQEFKVLEINARQGRCSYYISVLGANLIDIMVRDLIYKEDIPFYHLDGEVLLSFVPKNIIRDYVTNEKFKEYACKLWRKRIRPMECKLDRNLKRFLMMKKRLWHYKKEYQNSYWI